MPLTHGTAEWNKLLKQNILGKFSNTPSGCHMRYESIDCSDEILALTSRIHLADPAAVLVHSPTKRPQPVFNL